MHVFELKVVLDLTGYVHSARNWLFLMYELEDIDGSLCDTILHALIKYFGHFIIDTYYLLRMVL